MGISGESFPGGTIALGIFVGILSTSAQSIGLTLQRKSHMIEDAKTPLLRRAPHLCRRWQIGMALFLVANIIGSSVQISTLPLPVLSTLQASGLVFNGLCATLILNEPFTQLSLIGTILVCLGALLIAIFGAILAPTHDLLELLALMHRDAFIAWMAATGVVVVLIAVGTDLITAMTAKAQIRANPQVAARVRLARGLAYGCISGILSAHSLLIAKSAVELIIKTIIDGDNQFIHWQSWGAVGALITFALVQLSYLHRGLKLVSTSVLYPLVFCVYNIIAILDGLIYFEQADLISTGHAILITLGTLILLSGVLALSWRLHDQDDAAVSQTQSQSPIGFIDDTEEESLLGSESPSLVTSPLTSPIGIDRGASYQTFSPRAESYAEIWDDLHDQVPASPTSVSISRRSLGGSHMLVVDENTSLLGGQCPNIPTRPRRATGASLRSGHPRRKSSVTSGTGAGQLQSAVGGLFKMKWFSRKDATSDDAGRQTERKARRSSIVSSHRGAPSGEPPV